MNLRSAIAILALFVFSATPANADATRDNDQDIVVGIGFGVHTFSTMDDFRQDNTILNMPIDIAGSATLYGERYLWDRLGIGIRLNTLAVQKTTTVCLFSCSETVRNVTINNTVLTANWMPYISDDKYARLIVFAGPALSTYKISETSGTTTTISGSATGMAVMAGIYIDWGGEDFGARFGIDQLWAQKTKTNGYNLDASGHAYNFNLRWALR